MSENLQSVRVNIGKQSLQIQTDLDSSELNAIVEYIEDKLKQLESPSLKQNAERHLTLAAMAIASELFAERKHTTRLEANQEKVQGVVERLTSLLDEMPARNILSPTNAAQKPAMTIDPLDAAKAFLENSHPDNSK